MPCINADGSLTVVGELVLGSAHAGDLDPGSAARAAGVPLYRARASLRELAAAGLIAADDGTRYRITPAGEALLRSAREARVG